MESINYHEESEEAMEHSDQENNDLGVGRSYECVFCKRGFNTAQALGGHMNIHRKDRARNKPSNPNKLQQHHHQQIYTAPRLYNDNSFSPQDHQPIFTYATYFPASTSTSTRSPSLDHRDHHQAPVDWRMSLSLEFPPRIIEDHVEKNREGMNQDKDLDLELRLGYDS